MLAVTGGRVVTSLSPPSVVRADVAMDDGRVTQVERDVSSRTGPERIDASGCLVIPGNVCAHHHLYSALARGMPYRLEPPEDFVQVLRRVWWRLDRALDPATMWASAWAGGARAPPAGGATSSAASAPPNTNEATPE